MTVLIKPNQNEFIAAYEKMTGLKLEDSFVKLLWDYMGRIRNSCLNSGRVRIEWANDQIRLVTK